MTSNQSEARDLSHPIHPPIQSTKPFGYHPAYGLPDSYRRDAVSYAITHGVASAAKHYRVSLTSIYNWINAAKLVED
jgi:hypothetical protein